MGKDKDNRRPQHLRRHQSISPISSYSPSAFQLTRQGGFAEVYAATVQAAVEARKNYKVMDTIDNVTEDLTPNFLEHSGSVDKKLKLLAEKIADAEWDMKLTQRDLFPSQKAIMSKFNFDDTISLSAKSITSRKRLSFIDEDIDSSDDDESKEQQLTIPPPFIKIILRRSPEIVFFEQQSKTVLRGTPQAQLIDDDNKYYDFLTIGKGRMRRKNTSEAQTNTKLFNSRNTNTNPILLDTQKSHVSNFLMFQSMYNDGSSHMDDDVSSEKNVQEDLNKRNQAAKIFQKKEFKIALMKTLRLLAGNVFEQQQRRFRFIASPQTANKDKAYNCSLELLFQFNPQLSERQRKSVADIAFCPGNGDIIAAAYGIYSFGYMHVPDEGYCCVWNIKNPENPERKYCFTSAVVSVQFSPSTPQLLAIGLYDGTVLIHDISTFSENPIAVSLHQKTATWDPITAIEWVPQANVAGSENQEIEPILAVSADGSVIKYRIISSPHLLAFKQIQLDRVEGAPEGLQKKSTWNQTQSNRFPQGLNIKRHPSQLDIYYVLTDEGCIHKCSINYPHQHLSVLQAHIGSVNDMDFSPWSPKLFLTCGNDWCIRIWLDGILEPLITLRHEVRAIHSAAWSKTHSTIIVSNTRSSVDIWDIRRGTLRPVTSSKVDRAILTMFKFSRCGRSIAVGNEKGNVLVLALDDMPFPPHFQYDELELSIYKCLATKPNLILEVKSIGFFGYAEHQNARKSQAGISRFG